MHSENTFAEFSLAVDEINKKIFLDRTGIKRYTVFQFPS